MTKIELRFADGLVLEGYGQVEVEKGELFADGDHTVHKTDVVYLELQEGQLYNFESRELLADMEPGAYVLCRGGLYESVLPGC